MAAPNIINVTTITGKTAVANVSTTAADIVTNSAASGKVLKVNSLIVSNISGINSADITASVFRGAVEYKIASTITVPADATLVIVSKDTTIYLEEGDTIRVTASALSTLQAVCSYEEIS
jgi:uncharacterized protein YajQ (UPF0234 family)